VPPHVIRRPDIRDRFFRRPAWRSVVENARRTLRKGMRVIVVCKSIQHNCRMTPAIKRHRVEVQVTPVGPDLQFATAEVAKSTAEGLKWCWAEQERMG
jgi:single-strand DNA-binding protein